MVSMHVDNDRIKEWLAEDENDLNILVLSTALGTKPLMVGAKVNGVEPWTLEEVRQVAKAMKCEPMELITGIR